MTTTTKTKTTKRGRVGEPLFDIHFDFVPNLLKALFSDKCIIKVTVKRNSDAELFLSKYSSKF